MQAPGRADQRRHTNTLAPQPDLGNALIHAMESVIPIRIFRPFPLLMTRHLVGHETSKALGLNAHATWRSRLLFYTMLTVSRAIDSVARVVWPEFSITRFLRAHFGLSAYYPADDGPDQAVEAPTASYKTCQ